jgi:hypothetical protein
MAAPVRFETLDRQLKLAAGTVAGWSTQPGFPLAGSGVALADAVIEWRRSVDGAGLAAEPAVEPVEKIQERPKTETELASEAEVEYVTIRIPIKRGCPILSGAHPIPTVRVSNSERHIREALSAVFHGCRESHQQMRNGQHVDKRGHSLKFLLEAIAGAMGL